MKLAQKTEQPVVSLTQAALDALRAHHYSGNIRELENILERAATLCDGESIDAQDLALPQLSDDDASATVTPQTTGTQNLDQILDNEEAKRLVDALEQTRWNKTKAAKLLGITLRALRYRLEKYNIQ